MRDFSLFAQTMTSKATNTCDMDTNCLIKEQNKMSDLARVFLTTALIK